MGLGLGQRSGRRALELVPSPHSEKLLSAVRVRQAAGSWAPPGPLVLTGGGSLGRLWLLRPTSPFQAPSSWLETLL